MTKQLTRPKQKSSQSCRGSGWILDGGFEWSHKIANQTILSNQPINDKDKRASVSLISKESITQLSLQYLAS